MFKWLNKQGVESDEGFIVQVVSRFVIEYQQNRKTLSISIEMELFSGGKFGILILKSNFSCWDNGTSISVIDQSKIIKNFIDAMEFQGIYVEVED